MSRTLNILGVTGSIGQSAIDVVLAHPDHFTVNVISAHENVEGLADAAIRLNARKTVITNPQKLEELQARLQGTNIKCSSDLIGAISKKIDVTLMAIVGMAALRPSLAAAEYSKVLALASKEPIVAGGDLLLQTAERNGTKILPVDSEHNAIFQVSHGENPDAIEKIILTASGGPFRNWTAAQMRAATREQALAHPTWSMGAKISIDSATMMNKALEIIEAHYLFTTPPEKIEVIIHPQSIMHSLVEYKDGSILAQMGASDMRIPISYALGWPDRLGGTARKLDFKSLKSLDFEQPDLERFPALRLAYESLQNGHAHCIALNAANEVAVEAFLCGQTGFADILQIIEYVLGETSRATPSTLEEIEAIDAAARHLAGTRIQSNFNTMYTAVSV